MNLPIVIGMLSARTPLSNIIWQWANQSLNVAVNYANRNASNAMSLQQIGTAYAAAVVSSCSLAIGLGKVSSNLQTKTSIPPLLRTSASVLVPYLAVASAGAINVLLMRWNEGQDGIQIKDASGNILGTSKLAGQSALFQVTATRVALPAPILVLPPVLMRWYDGTKIHRSYPKVRFPVEVGVIAACLWLALPLAIGLFPQVSEIDVKKLEKEFHNLKDNSGKVVTHAYFNKGL
jgi:hypothetical protein